MIMTLVEIINEIPQDFERQANRGDERSAYLTHAVPNHYLLSMSEVGIKILVILLDPLIISNSPDIKLLPRSSSNITFDI